MKRFYIVVRNDLDPGVQIAQAVHAAMAFSVVEPELVRAWVEGENNLVVLSIGSEGELAALGDRVRARARVLDVHEPDLDDQLTAIAFDDRSARDVSSLPLALSWRSLERKLAERSAQPRTQAIRLTV